MADAAEALVISRPKEIKDWALPDSIPPSGKRTKRRDFWGSKFTSWCECLVKLNKDQDGILDPELVRDAWNLWLQRQSSMSVDRKSEAANVQAV